MRPYLRDHLPIEEVDKGFIVSKFGDSTLGYELIMPEIHTLSGEQLELLCRTWEKILVILGPNTILHKQDWYWQTTWQGNLEKPASFLSGASERYHHGRPYLAHRCYLFFTRRPQRRAIGGGKALLSKNLVPQDTLSERAAQEFAAEVSQCMHILADSGLIQYRALSTEELAGTADTAGLIEQYCQLTMPGETPELRDIHLGEQMRIGNNYLLMHTLADAEHLPVQCSPVVAYPPYSTERTPFPTGFVWPLGLSLRCNHIYNQYIIKEALDKTRKKLEQKRHRMQSLSAHSRQNALGKEAVDAYLNEAIGESQLMIKAHFNILSWTSQIDAVERLRDMVVAAITKMGAVAHLETVGGPQLWCAGIPGNAADIPHYELIDMLANQALCFLAPDTNYRENSVAGLRLCDRLYGRPLEVDLSDEPMRAGMIANRNKAVFGGSGSGKSFFTNHMMRSYHERGAHILIVDIGNSYKGLCDLTRGYYFMYTEQSPLRLNPFWLPAGEAPDTEKRESLKTLLLALWKKEDETFLRSEYVALSHALQLYYQKVGENPGLFACFDSFYEFLSGEFVSVLAGDKVKGKDFDMDNFLYVLRPYYKGGEFDFLLNAREQLNLLQERFIVFELDAVKDHPILFPVVTIVIMEVFISKMRKLPGIRKIILIEEAWKAIARQGMSEYLKYLFKTVRKFFGEAIVVTQEAEDIISSLIVKQAILNSTDCKILLDQSKFRNKFDELQALLSLTEHDKALVLSLNQHRDPNRQYKEVFISLGSNYSKVYRTEVSMEEYLTYTTEEKEKVQVQQWAQRHGGLEKGIMALAKALRDGSFKWLITGLMILGSLLMPSQNAQAQFPIAAIINMAVKRVIVATDLAIQRMQTKTIGLQNAQKALENAMQLDRLTDIADWMRRQKELFEGYYQELWQVKDALLLYHKVKDIVERQAQLAASCKKALFLLRQDPHFSMQDLENMGKVYGAILDKSIRNARELTRVVTGFVTQMQDGDRLAIIDRIGQEADQNRRDLAAFTQENILLSLQRSKSQQEIHFVQILYNHH